jgi:hypothetical protein
MAGIGCKNVSPEIETYPFSCHLTNSFFKMQRCKFENLQADVH